MSFTRRSAYTGLGYTTLKEHDVDGDSFRVVEPIRHINDPWCRPPWIHLLWPFQRSRIDQREEPDLRTDRKDLRWGQCEQLPVQKQQMPWTGFLMRKGGWGGLLWYFALGFLTERWLYFISVVFGWFTLLYCGMRRKGQLWGVDKHTA